VKTKEEIENICGDIIDSESINDQYKQSVYEGCVLGYTQCQEDNKEKRYTEGDLHTILKLRREWYSHTDKNVVKDYINSLKKQD